MARTASDRAAPPISSTRRSGMPWPVRCAIPSARAHSRPSTAARARFAGVALDTRSPCSAPEAFGRFSERIARFLGTGKFLFWQTVVVLIWMAINLTAVSFRWDPYPFILLNLAFSTQAAYAAPLILLAQTRQAERERVKSEAFTRHQEAVEAALERNTDELRKALEANTALTREIRDRLA